MRWPKPSRISISPLEGEMPGRAEGGEVPRSSVHFPVSPNSFIPHGTAERVIAREVGRLPGCALIWFGVGRMRCAAGSFTMPYLARTVHCTLRHGPFHERCQRSTTRTVPWFPPRLASTRQDCDQYNSLSRSGEKRG
ncbi:hypothetical protein EGT36_14695 [Agrobacterium sp. FDAARGOS_525]|nr:hypothetical protein EGT36_14695 [Agrobacterium sp. FDAARGOS_525]